MRTFHRVGGREVRVTNLDKLFWPDLGITKGDLLHDYASVDRASRTRSAVSRTCSKPAPGTGSRSKWT